MQDVWAPIVVAGNLVVPFTLQRLSELLASTAPLETKMSEAQNLCDSIAQHVVEPDACNKSLKKMLGSQLCVTWHVSGFAYASTYSKLLPIHMQTSQAQDAEKDQAGPPLCQGAPAQPAPPAQRAGHRDHAPATHFAAGPGRREGKKVFPGWSCIHLVGSHGPGSMGRGAGSITAGSEAECATGRGLPDVLCHTVPPVKELQSPVRAG